jgi:hypothetical protein
VRLFKRVDEVEVEGRHGRALEHRRDAADRWGAPALEPTAAFTLVDNPDASPVAEDVEAGGGGGRADRVETVRP